jgi:hypothetical protein
MSKNKTTTLFDDYGNKAQLKNGKLSLVLASTPLKGAQRRNLGSVLNGVWVVNREAKDIYKPNQSFSLADFIIGGAPHFGIHTIDFYGVTESNEVIEGTLTPQEWLGLSTTRHMAHYGYEPQADVPIKTLTTFFKEKKKK